MKLSELLTPERIRLSVEAGDLRGVVRELTKALTDAGDLEAGAAEGVVREVLEGENGDQVRANEAFLVAAASTEGVRKLTAALGVSPVPFRVDERGDGHEATMARGLLLLLTPRRFANLRIQAIPALVRSFRDRERSRAVLEAASPEEALAPEWLEGVDVHDELLVQDALTPLKYRVYPDTPMTEVVDLIVRRGLHAVPVVGENHEVLGIITSGDALAHLLPRRVGGEEDTEPPLLARDVMSRSVLCVSEDQALVEAANTMINKQVAQLPVVREGQLIGFLTRETVLRQLFGY